MQHSSDRLYSTFFFFVFKDTATTEIYTLSLHDALPIFDLYDPALPGRRTFHRVAHISFARLSSDRKSTRLNSSHITIWYAVFCLKKRDGSCPCRRCVRTSGAELAGYHTGRRV